MDIPQLYMCIYIYIYIWDIEIIATYNAAHIQLGTSMYRSLGYATMAKRVLQFRYYHVGFEHVPAAA